jgi:hypothetical protein
MPPLAVVVEELQPDAYVRLILSAVYDIRSCEENV